MFSSKKEKKIFISQMSSIPFSQEFWIFSNIFFCISN